MTDINKSIIEMLNENRNIKDIAHKLNISEKQLYVRLKQIINYGYQLVPSYCYNSDIYYRIEKGIYVPKENEISIKLPSSNKEFRCIVISDMHIGNIASDIDLLKIVYEYAAKNGINIIFNCGDSVEGIYSSDKKNIDDIYKQVEFFLKKYPYDKNINNFTLLGNHDYHSLHYDGLDISKRIQSARYDIIPIGYGESLVKIKEDSLLLKHELSVVETPDLVNNPRLTILGHGHLMKTKVYENFFIGAPSLSYVSPNKKKEILPGFIDMTLHLEKGRFEFVEAHHMIITPKVYEASVSRCRLKKMYNNHDKGKR